MSLLHKFRQIWSGPVARGSIIAILIRGSGLALGVIQAILTARLLGPAGYGVVALVFAVATALATVAMMGADTYSTREVARLKALGDVEAERGFVQRTLLIVIAVSMFLSLALFAVRAMPVADVWSESLTYLHFTAMLMPLLALSFLLKGIHGGLGDVKWSLLPFNVARPLIFVFFLAVIYLSDRTMTLDMYLWGTLVTTAIGLLFASGKLVANFKISEDSAARSPLFLPWITAAAPLFLIGLLELLYGQVGTFMLAWWSTPEQTGLFQPIVRVMPILMLTGSAIAARFDPRISEFHSTGQLDRLRVLIGTVTLVSCAMTLISAVVLIYFANSILGLFGPEFQSVVPALWWIAGAQVFNGLTGSSLQVLTMSGNGKKAVVPQLAGLVAMIGMGALLIPGGGAVAAAQAMAAGIVVMHSLAYRAAYLSVGIDTSIINSFRQSKFRYLSHWNQRRGD